MNGARMPNGIVVPTQDAAVDEEEEPARLRLVDDPVEAQPAEAMPPARPAAPAGDGEMSRDRQQANGLVKLVQDLNRAMDEAKRNGLIVEPSLSTVQSQFGGDGSAGHLLSVKVFRKLC